MRNPASGLADGFLITVWTLLLISPALTQTEDVRNGGTPERASIKLASPGRSMPELEPSLVPGMGFSFFYRGQKVGPGDPGATWKVEMRTRDGVDETIFRHRSGLAAIRRLRSFPQAGAIEYTVWFKNEGSSVLPAISAINAMALSLTGEVVSGAAVLSSGGGTADAQFPPKNFALKWTPLAASAKDLTLDSSVGLPSVEHLPFFFVHNQEKTSGFFFAIGWTGQWKANIRLDTGGQTICLQAGIPELDLRLRPGEEISGPTILVGGYRGPLAVGSNRLRRLIRTHFAPGVGGRELLAPVLYTTWFDIGAELDEKLLGRLADCAAEMGIEVFLVDAGWYAGTPTRPYADMNSTWQAISHSLGNWEKGEERSRFPSGLKVLAEQVRSRGMEFGLWFEPERAGPNSLLAREHPDWVRRGPRDGWLLVDFGKPEVQDYFCTILDRFIRDLKIRYIRWDHNLHDGPLPFCRLMDPADRRGISQIRFVEGLHRVEDWVRQHHPGVILESCAGGGRRIDLDTLRRRHTIWISDQTMKTEIIRFHLEGLNHFLPGTGLLVGFTPPPSLYQRNEKLPDIHYQSHFGGAFGAAGRIHQWSIPIREQMQNHVKVFKKTRRFLNEDYYLLGPQNRSLESWSAWQFHDPKADEGFVQAFRLGATEGSRRFVLRGLRPDVGYRFTDPYTGKTLERKGGTLLSQGLEFNLSQTSSQVWLYRKLRPAGAGTATPPAYFRVKSRS